jgi:F-type H+-transporting ATPase subunit b
MDGIFVRPCNGSEGAMRLVNLAGCLGFVGVLLLAVQVSAGQPHGEDAKPEAAHSAAPAPEGHAPGAAHAGEQPGLFPKSYDLGIWSLVVFLALFLILQKKAWPMILANLQKREQGILQAIAEAEQGRQEAAKMRLQLQKELDNASDKVREMMEEARRDAQHARDEMMSEARNEIQSERERMRREIEVARDQALQHIWTQAAQLATLISTKAIRRTTTPDDHRRFVDEALAELRTAGSQRSAV